MKNFIVFSLLCVSFLCSKTNKLELDSLVKDPSKQLPIVVVVCSYNNERYCIGNLQSIFRQDYDNFRVIYVNDASKDRTGDLVKSYIEHNKLFSKITYIENEENQKAMANTYAAIHMCDNEEIVIIVDGDDRLYGTDVMQTINRAYHNDHVWMTYGQYKKGFSFAKKSKKGCSFPVNVEILQKRNHRKVKYRWSHLRTFYAGLFNLIPKKRFMKEGKFLSYGHDVALMMNLIDLSRDHTYFIGKILYEYNNQNPIADHRVHLKDQVKSSWDALGQKPLPFTCNSKEEFLQADVL